MDLFEDDLLQEKKKVKKIGKGIIIAGVIVVILIIAVVVAIGYFQSKQLGTYIDGVATAFSADTYYVEDSGKIYLSIKNLSSSLNYNYYNGEYGKASEDARKGFVEPIEGEGEAVSFEANSKKIYKNILSVSSTTSKEKAANYMYIDEPIKYINGNLYTTIEGINELFNVKIAYDEVNNKIVIYSLPYLVQTYTTQIANYGYKERSAEFVNQKAVEADMIVVERENGKLGVINTEGKEIIGAKYDGITYLESTNEFVVENENKVGIVNNLGTTKIPLNYEDLELLDNDTGLYIAKSGDYYGVIDRNGNKIIHTEYDAIGIDQNLFQSKDITNPYLLYNNCIPVQKDEKWGIYDKSGKIILPIEFDMIGCVISSGQSGRANNAVILPDYEAIIVGKNMEENGQEVEKYAVYNALGNMLVPFMIDSIYYVTQNGEDVYEMEVADQTGNVDEVFKQNGIQKVKKDVVDTTTGGGNINIDSENIISNGNNQTTTESEGQTEENGTAQE